MIGCSFSLPSYRRRRALYEPGEAYEPGGGVYKEVQTPALCDYTVQLRGGVAWRDCTVRLYGGATRCGRVAWRCCVIVVLVCRIVPGALSTGVIHSVENLHACDLVERS